MNTVLNASQPSADAGQTDYDTWLLREIQEAIDDPRPSISHEEAVRRWESQANQLRHRVCADAQVLTEV